MNILHILTKTYINKWSIQNIVKITCRISVADLLLIWEFSTTFWFTKRLETNVKKISKTQDEFKCMNFFSNLCSHSSVGKVQIRQSTILCTVLTTTGCSWQRKRCYFLQSVGVCLYLFRSIEIMWFWLTIVVSVVVCDGGLRCNSM